MATPISRPTYGGWLDQIAEQGRTDEYGLVASAWLAAKASGRPKLSAVRSVNAWLSEHPPPGVANLQATLHQLSTAYHEAGGLDHQQPAPPAGAPSAPPPAGETAGQQPLWPADSGAEMSPAGPIARMPDQQPAQAADAEAWGGQPPPASHEAWLAEGQPPSPQVTAVPVPGEQHVAVQQPGQPPEHPYQVIMLAIGRLEALVTSFWQAADPLIKLAAEAMSVDEALDASPLSASPQVAEAQERVSEIARRSGWTPGPAFEPAPPDFYGGHVVPAPDFASMAQASDGREEDAQ